MAIPQHAVKVTPAVIAQRSAMVQNAPTALTLNGNPATVTDRNTGLSAEWSWETVDHVVHNRFGAFKS